MTVTFFNPLYAKIDSALLVIEREIFSSFFSVLFGQAIKHLKTKAKVFTNSSKVS